MTGSRSRFCGPLPALAGDRAHPRPTLGNTARAPASLSLRSNLSLMYAASDTSQQVVP